MSEFGTKLLRIGVFVPLCLYMVAVSILEVKDRGSFWCAGYCLVLLCVVIRSCRPQQSEGPYSREVEQMEMFIRAKTYAERMRLARERQDRFYKERGITHTDRSNDGE